MSTKINLALDITIFIAFLVVANPGLTGMTIHQWIALAFAAAIVTHLLLHWNWLVMVTRQFFKRLFHQSRLNYVVDALFFVAMTASMLSGLMISKSILATLGIQLDVSHGWETIHKLASDASLILLGLHFALHFKWVVSSLKGYVASSMIYRLQRTRARALTIQTIRVNKND
jgi:hypothetical protein